MQQITPMLLALAPYLAPFVFALVGLQFKKLWDTLPTNQRTLLSNAVGTAVAAVQQTMPDAPGVTKKSQAMALVAQQLQHIGLSVPMPVVDQLIEEAVFSLKGFLSVTAPTSAPASEADSTNDQTVPLHAVTMNMPNKQ